MSGEIHAVALCRVSSREQLENNSLGHQRNNVLIEAKKLNAIIPDDAVWEGAVSAKKGVNLKRKDLQEIYEYCKRNSKVKYLIVQEVDRFMRSPEEQTYFYVKFKNELDVQIWFADKPELNEDSHVASMLRFMEGWRAAGSNLERQSKSINGQVAALKEGRFPFAPKPGYKKGRRPGIQEVHSIRGPALKKILQDIAEYRMSPTEALKHLNRSAFMNDGHSAYKMDKFRKILVDPFYAGIVEINKQVNFRNENGLHEPLISKEQHYELIRIMDTKPKVQQGPLKEGNLKYPLNNIVSCGNCKANNNRYVGFDHSNGKNKKVIYEKYRCRSCGKYVTREKLHTLIRDYLNRYTMEEKQIQHFLNELEKLWNKKETDTRAIVKSHKLEIIDLKSSVEKQVKAAIDPCNFEIKDDILEVIKRTKLKIEELESETSELESKLSLDRKDFLDFALRYIYKLGTEFMELSKEKRLKCKQILFPEGFTYVGEDIVYTTKMSIIYRLASTKKDTLVSSNSLMVRVKRL